MGDMLGHTVKAAAAKVAAAAANEEAAQQLHPLMQSSVEALRTADQPVTSETLKASLQLRIPDVRDKALNKVGLVPGSALAWHSACGGGFAAPRTWGSLEHYSMSSTCRTP